MTDITIALETVREALWHATNRVMFDARKEQMDDAFAALSTIEAELTRLRESGDYWERNFRKMTDQAVTYKEARDEAVAALREALTDARVMGHLQLQTFKTADDVLARLSTPKENPDA